LLIHKKGLTVNGFVCVLIDEAKLQALRRPENGAMNEM
jgi:hypothetical protein